VSSDVRDVKSSVLMTCIAYSPQLGAKLGISHTQLNIVALAGNGAIYHASVEL